MSFTGRRVLILVQMTALALCAAVSTAHAQPLAPPEDEAPPVLAERNTAEWNLTRAGRNRVGIKGFDPVAYFPEGGSEAVRGDGQLMVTFRGTAYFFSTVANRDMFVRNPSRYEPAYGGWCALAMTEGDKADINPNAFIVKDDRLFLFYEGLFGDSKAEWLEADHDTQADSADDAWRTISGEEPRRIPPRAGVQAPEPAADQAAEPESQLDEDTDATPDDGEPDRGGR